MKKILRHIYYILPFKIELFSLIKTFWIPRFYSYLNVKGEFVLKPNQGDEFKVSINYFQYLEKEFFWNGFNSNWEKISLRVWARACKESNIIVDIGANSGIYSLLAKSINRKSQVFSFEPVDENFRSLKKNVEINNFNININKIAVSNLIGEGEMFVLPNEANYMTSLNLDRNITNKRVRRDIVKTERFDNFIIKNNIQNIDLVKIDVEEHEAEVFEGFGHYLSEFKPKILVEVIGEKNAFTINSFAQKENYFVYRIDEKSIPEKVDKIVPNNHHNYFLSPEIESFDNLWEIL